MKQIKRKLHSNSGASVILALALMLICVMVSAVIVAAAASGVNRNETEKKKQQEYLAITSAAQYIAEELNESRNDVYCGVYYKDLHPCSRYRNYVMYQIRVGGSFRDVYAIPTPYASLEGGGLAGISVLQFYLYVRPENVSLPYFCNIEPRKDTLDSAGETSFSGDFAAMMKEAATQVYKNEVVYTKEFTISVDDTRIPAVKCKFKMDKEYHVTVELESALGGSEYSMVVEMPIKDRIDNSTGYTTTEECLHECFYEYVDDFGNVQATTPVQRKFIQQVDNPTTTIIWGTPVIRKG